MARLSLRQITKSYSAFTAVRGIDLDVEQNEFVVLVGPSGCGKSTTLRMIAGLEDITDGELWIGDKVVNDMAPGDRDIAMVFQNYALYPHMTVRENISFGLKQRKMPRPEIKNRVDEAARMLDISALMNRKPRELSGGQRQRVAMGRAMVRNPEVFLFDEPLSNLDAKLRVQMRTEIKRLHQRAPTTTVYVTHDQIEAMTLADRVVVMNQGLIEQVGPPQDLYHNPATRFVAGFIGSPAMNFMECRIEQRQDGLAVVLSSGLVLSIPMARHENYAPYRNKPMIFGIRPEHLADARGSTQPGNLNVVVDVVEPLGLETLVTFMLGDNPYSARLDPDTRAKSGEPLTLSVDMNHMHLIDPTTELVVRPRT
jgi:multiple sugar transport system ATP-binding protein